MERSSRIIGGKGEVVYKALQDILYKNPFNKKLLLMMKNRIKREKLLKKIFQKSKKIIYINYKYLLIYGIEKLY